MPSNEIERHLIKTDTKKNTVTTVLCGHMKPYDIKMAETEGFEPSRRVNDLYP